MTMSRRSPEAPPDDVCRPLPDEEGGTALEGAKVADGSGMPEG
jgi:hypothetical protein